MARFAVFLDAVESDVLSGLDNASRRRAAFQAINKAARDARAEAARRIRGQVNLPASYVSPSNKRLYVSKKAQGSDLEAVITAQGRATSLARFATNRNRVGKAGVYVQVKPGAVRFMRRAFVIRLPGVDGRTDPGLGNLGLAIRLRPGERLENKLQARRVENGLYVLYGPSVSQVFRANDGEGVANDIAPSVARDLESEFLRLLDL